MTVPDKLKDYLDKSGVPYQILSHREAYTAQETAAAAHIHGKDLAKVVMVRANGKMIMAVLPTSHRIDPNKLAKALGVSRAQFAGEDEFSRLFSDCETGAEPPFGNLYGVELYADKSLAEDAKVYFNAGTHHEMIEMSYADYERIAKPIIADFAKHL